MTNIPKTGTEVDAKRLSDNTNANKQSLGNKASAESAGSSGSSNNGLGLTKLTEAQLLKEKISFSMVLMLDGHQTENSGENKRCLCPFHAERTPSFTVFANTYAKCFGCGWRGDVITYAMHAYGVGFKEALLKLQNHDARKFRKALPVYLSRLHSDSPEDLTQDQKNIVTKACERLRSDEWLWGRVADERGWQRETIHQLAIDGSLGWYGGALAFVYGTGLKLRNWPKKELLWEFGHGCLWRTHRIDKAERVFVTEGETDAIALIDAGAEKDSTVAVVSIPSATTFAPAWGRQFTDKVVTLCFDNDEAGDKAFERIAPSIAPYVTQLLTVDLKEVS